MEGSSYAASVKADPNLFLRTVTTLDIEGSDKVSSDIRSSNLGIVSCFTGATLDREAKNLT